VRGIEDRKLLKQNKVQMDGAEALDSTFQGIVDNVDIQIRTVVLVKNFCTFDFIHVVIPKKAEDKDEASFDHFLASFKTR